MDERWSARLLAAGLRQPDPVSCGASCLVIARALGDEAYAEFLVTGRHSTTGYRRPGNLSARFAAEVGWMHRGLTSGIDLRGRLQLPWWRRLGTPPWTVARQLSELSAQEIRYRVRRGRARIVPTLCNALDSGAPVPLYVGSARLPRHVVLAIGRSDADRSGRIDCYEPASGHVFAVSLATLRAGRCPLGGWTHWWWAVLPNRVADGPRPVSRRPSATHELSVTSQLQPLVEPQPSQT